jgi:hypothetical protein
MHPHRRRPTFAALLAALALPVTALAGLDIEILYDHAADFSAYETWRWAAEPVSETPEAVMVHERIRQVSEAELGRKGLRAVGEGETADLLLTYHVRTEDNLVIEGVRYELAPHVVWTGASPLDVTSHYEVGTLVLDLADAASEKIVWSGVVQGRAATVGQLRDQIEKAVRKLLKRYPPG